MWDSMQQIGYAPFAYALPMARKKLVYTAEFPYHITARSNNKEAFPLGQVYMWDIFKHELNKQVTSNRLMVHAFVLMLNHYHMIASVIEGSELGGVTRDIQRNTTRTVNSHTGRINHLFGGSYKASLITNPQYYMWAIRYVYRNPVKAGLVDRVEKYPFSTINDQSGIICCSLSTDIGYTASHEQQIEWYNKEIEPAQYLAIQKGLRRTVFKPATSRNY